MAAMRLAGARGRSALVAPTVVAALAGCMSDGGRSPRNDGCFIGGCSSEVCSDRTDYFTPCIWREAYACFRDARCERQPDGACGWTPTPELEACLASHDPAPRALAGSLAGAPRAPGAQP
jgi:eight-cysteine-cluster-containing protein